MSHKRWYWVAVIFLFCAPSLFSQTGGPEKRGLDPAFVLERDIATSTVEELADWCRSLGLDDAGSKETLAARLREYHNFPEPASPPDGTEPGTETAEGSKGTEEAAAVIETSAGTGVRPILITIESARSTDYFTVASVNEEYVRLRGDVSLSLKDGEILHRIKAEEILYNRTRKLLSASGGVVYIKEEGDTVATFRGEGITVNLDNWSTAFMRGVSDRELADGETRYRFAGEVISRSGEDSTVMRRAEITNPDDEESHWSIKASRLWLLPGSDWAVLNAVIKVGEVPVLWLPAFFYPANEIIFHPVLGFRSREGTYVQTTTYIMGRPKAASSSEESSITTIMGSGEGMEKVREGVFLRSTGRKVRDSSEPRLSLMADAYANLGYFVGSELNLPEKEHFGELLFSSGIGFSRDITLVGDYTPFYPDYDGGSRWHRSRFFGYDDLPFRYRFVTSGSVHTSGSVVRESKLAWSFPFYSDPYMDNDFMRRSEDSSLFSLLKSATTPDMTVSDKSLDSYIWQLNGNLGFVTTGMEPYVNELAITSAAAAVAFETRTTNPHPSAHLAYSPSYPPDAKFYYPDKLTLFSVSAAIGGTPITLGERPEGTGELASLPWGTPNIPWTDPENQNGSNYRDPLDMYPPDLSRTINVPVLGGHRFTMDYRLTPSASSEIKFNSDKVDGGRDLSWKNAGDIDWGDMAHQLYTIRSDGNLGLTLSEKRDIYTHSLRFYSTTSWQDYTYMNETSAAYNTAQKRDNTMRQAHNMTYFSNAAEYNFILRPFYRNEVWGTSNFQYNVKGLLVKGSYDANDSWEVRGGRWNQDDLEFQRFQANFNANVMDKMQNLSLTADIPPEESTLAGDATARVWISETNARHRIRKPFDDPYYEPVYLTETLTFTERISLRHYMVYDPELSDFTIMTTSFTWGGLTASFTATRSFSYYLDTNPASSGWKISPGSEERLNPQELSIAYNKTHSIDNGGKVTFEGTVNTGLRFDLQRYTYSKFFFILGLTTKINRFLDITLKSNSENAVVYRYFQDMPFFSQDIDMPGEKNPFVDLFNSFRFDDTRRRESSGFKLKSFGLDLVHHLGDWDATVGINLSPEFVSSEKRYRFFTQVSLAVQWKPIKEFKASVDYNTKDGLIVD